MKITRLIIFLLTLCVFLIKGVASETTKTTYYVSSSKGSDSNNGLKESEPLKSICKIKSRKNIELRLKSGDVFYETISGFNDSKITTYGGNKNAIICGFKILQNPSAWIKSDTVGLWRLDLTKQSNFTGCVSSNDKYPIYLNNIGMIYDYKNDKIYGHNVPMKWDLKSQGDFFVTQHFKKDSVLAHPIKELIFKYDKDPQSLGNLMFSTAQYGISNMNNCTISNISVVGFSLHGISSCNNTTISHCAVDMIGGAIQFGQSYWIRYGNGIEFWNACKNNLITDCTISRTYDCGATIQANCEMKSNPENIHFIGNKFYHCRQAFEHFLKPTNNFEADYVNCSFEDNICYEMGENEFSSQEKRDANLLSYDTKQHNILIRNNTFFGAPLYCGNVFSKSIADNTIYIYKGQYLNHYHGVKNYPTIYANEENDINEYRKRTNDNSKIIILDQNSADAVQYKKKIKNKIGWEKTDLKIK